MDRILHNFAELVITLAYAWYCFYFMLLYRPVGEHTPGGKNDQPLQDTLSVLGEKWCPRDLKGGCQYTMDWIYPAFLAFTFITFFTRKMTMKPQRPGRLSLAGDMDFVLWAWIG